MSAKTIAARGDRSVGQPSGAEVNRLWTILVAGLVAVTLIALIGVIYAVGAGKSPDVLVTVFTSALTGLIGLFVRSPG